MGWKRLRESGVMEGGAACASGKAHVWQENGLLSLPLLLSKD